MYLTPVILFTCRMFDPNQYPSPSCQLLTRCRKVKSPNKIGKLLQSAMFFLRYLEIYILKCRDCLGSRFYFISDWICIYYPCKNCSIYNSHRYQIWIMSYLSYVGKSCETISVHIILFLIFHFLKKHLIHSSSPFIICACTFSVYVSLKNSMTCSS